MAELYTDINHFIDAKTKNDLIRVFSESHIKSLKICGGEDVDPGSLGTRMRRSLCNDRGDKVEIIGHGSIGCLHTFFGIKSANIVRGDDPAKVLPTVALIAKKEKERKESAEACSSAARKALSMREVFASANEPFVPSQESLKQVSQNRDDYIKVIDELLNIEPTDFTIMTNVNMGIKAIEDIDKIIEYEKVRFPTKSFLDAANWTPNITETVKFGRNTP